MSTTVRTVGATARAHATATLWEAATDNNLVTGTVIEEGHMYDDADFDELVTMSGATTSALYYRHLMAAAGEEYDPIVDVGSWLLNTGANSLFLIDEDYLRLSSFGANCQSSNAWNHTFHITNPVRRGAQLKNIYATRENESGILYSTTNGAEVKLINCIGKVTDPAADGSRIYDNGLTAPELLTDGGIELWDDAVTPTIWSKTEGGTSTVNREAVEQRSGIYCARLDVDASNSVAQIQSANTALVDGISYRLSFFHFETGAATCKYAIRVTGGNYLQANGSWDPAAYYFSEAHAAGWTEVQKEFVPDVAATYNIHLLRSSAASESVYFDDASLQHVDRSVSLFNCVGYLNPAFTAGQSFRLRGAGDARNCIGVGSPDGDFDVSVGGTESNNISSDATAAGAGSVIDQKAANLFRDAANNDFRLKAGCAAIDEGADLSGDGVDTDFTGAARVGNWDIGAYMASAFLGAAKTSAFYYYYLYRR